MKATRANTLPTPEEVVELIRSQGGSIKFNQLHNHWHIKAGEMRTYMTELVKAGTICSERNANDLTIYSLPQEATGLAGVYAGRGTLHPSYKVVGSRMVNESNIPQSVGNRNRPSTAFRFSPILLA